LAPLVTDDGKGGSFVGPTINEFFPDPVLLVGTPFELNRIMLIRLLVVVILIVLFSIGTRRMKVIPGRFQSLVEMGFDFVRVGIAENILGKADGKRFLPLLTTFFFMIIAMDLTGIIPGLNIAGTSVIGVPLVLAAIAYVTWIYAGLRKHPGTFLRNAIVPPGVPWPLYIIVTPIEIFSTFIIRPITHTLRLLLNLLVGHLLLVLCFLATDFFIVSAPGFFKLFGIATFAFGFAFTLLEILIAILQAYVFTILTAVYLQLALSDEH
jgi:F-type H+-transporting ATPase subunit a